MSDLGLLKERVEHFVDRIARELVWISRQIHARPELGYHEHFAADLLCDSIHAHGWSVERGVGGLETAFRARAGESGPHVVVCCEYDALPDIGHGCGHNVIGAAGLGAGLALAEVSQAAGGRVTILGTPAEELSGGGKIKLLEAGAFDGADAAMMVHPEPADVAWVPYLANDVLKAEFFGTASHASSTPWRGANALDGLVLAYQSLYNLRGHLPPDHKVFGIITDGGHADNTIPAYASGRFRARAPRESQLEDLRRRVLACFDGAARMTGTTFSHEWLGGYTDLVSNRPLALAYQRNGERLGRTFVDPRRVPTHVAGSTDMGNVSKALPVIHPVIKICELDVPGHSPAMAEAARSPAADRAVVDGAKALAMTGLDLWLEDGLLEEVRADFAARVTRR